MKEERSEKQSAVIKWAQINESEGRRVRLRAGAPLHYPTVCHLFPLILLIPEKEALERNLRILNMFSKFFKRVKPPEHTPIFLCILSTSISREKAFPFTGWAFFYQVISWPLKGIFPFHTSTCFRSQHTGWQNYHLKQRRKNNPDVHFSDGNRFQFWCSFFSLRVPPFLHWPASFLAKKDGDQNQWNFTNVDCTV